MTSSVIVRQNIKTVAVTVHLVGRDTLISGRRTCSCECGAAIGYAQITVIAFQLRKPDVVPCHRRSRRELYKAVLHVQSIRACTACESSCYGAHIDTSHYNAASAGCAVACSRAVIDIDFRSICNADYISCGKGSCCGN